MKDNLDECPNDWGGFLFKPYYFEFWKGHESRLNERDVYEIKNGKIGRPIKGATLIGNGPDVLKKVSMVANNLELDNGIGTCGKEGQSVPVGVGQPSLKVDNLTVGGTV